MEPLRLFTVKVNNNILIFEVDISLKLKLFIKLKKLLGVYIQKEML